VAIDPRRQRDERRGADRAQRPVHGARGDHHADQYPRSERAEGVGARRTPQVERGARREQRAVDGVGDQASHRVSEHARRDHDRTLGLPGQDVISDADRERRHHDQLRCVLERSEELEGHRCEEQRAERDPRGDCLRRKRCAELTDEHAPA
jgi:hypothetical protein